jgi:hypothetical protein
LKNFLKISNKWPFQFILGLKPIISWKRNLKKLESEKYPENCKK